MARDWIAAKATAESGPPNSEQTANAAVE